MSLGPLWWQGSGTGPRKPLVVPRTYRGNMCGVRVQGVEAVSGGADDPTLILSWFIDRYASRTRADIYQAWHDRGIVDVLVSWPDSRADGASPEQFVATCKELVDNAFLPTVMFCSKDIDPADVRSILANIAEVLPLLIASHVIARGCVGWELSLWLSPTQVQQLIDALAPTFATFGIKLYVHFQSGYLAFQQPGGVTADFWKLNVGKLTGILHQADLEHWDKPMYQARIVDCLQRFAGQFSFPTDSGFGHPFDFIALEISADLQFRTGMSEAEGNSWGDTALSVPPVDGVGVMGSGNGQSR